MTCAVGYPAATGYSYLAAAPVTPTDRLSTATYLTDYGALAAGSQSALTLPRADTSTMAINTGNGRPDQLALRTAPNGESPVCRHGHWLTATVCGTLPTLEERATSVIVTQNLIKYLSEGTSTPSLLSITEDTCVCTLERVFIMLLACYLLSKDFLGCCNCCS